jgi:uncharacterized protein YukE
MNRMLLRGFGLAVLAAAIAVGVASGVESKAAVAPANSSAPSISGTTTTGSTVTANQGTWTGSAPISYQYQWQICDEKGNACHDITGATAQTYVIKDADKGNTLRVNVIASNSDGSKTATSPATADITAGGTGPANTQAPSITGSLTAGSTVTADNGNWTGTAPITYAYQWQTCDANGNGCKDISGETKQTYVVQKGDTGNTLRVRVTATNASGSTAATSGQSGQIGAATGSNGCGTPAAGGSSVQVTDVASPARLQITSFFSNPRVIPGSFSSFQLQVHIADTCGHAVQGAAVYATAVPFNQVSIPSQQMTDSSGNTTLQFNRMQGFPAAKKQQLMVLFVRASKPGDNILAGISTRRLVSLRVNLKQNT